MLVAQLCAQDTSAVIMRDSKSFGEKHSESNRKSPGVESNTDLVTPRKTSDRSLLTEPQFTVLLSLSAPFDTIL